jgi:hypothetical protein
MTIHKTARLLGKISYTMKREWVFLKLISVSLGVRKGYLYRLFLWYTKKKA